MARLVNMSPLDFPDVDIASASSSKDSTSGGKKKKQKTQKKQNLTSAKMAWDFFIVLSDDFFPLASSSSLLAYLSLRNQSFVSIPRAASGTGSSVSGLAAVRPRLPGKRFGLRTVFQCEGKAFHVKPRKQAQVSASNGESASPGQRQQGLASLARALRQGGIASPANTRITVSEGQQWVALTWEVSEFIARSMEDKSSKVSTLLDYLRHFGQPEELFFQTLLTNMAPFCQKGLGGVHPDSLWFVSELQKKSYKTADFDRLSPRALNSQDVAEPANRYGQFFTRRVALKEDGLKLASAIESHFTSHARAMLQDFQFPWPSLGMAAMREAVERKLGRSGFELVQVKELLMDRDQNANIGRLRLRLGMKNKALPRLWLSERLAVASRALSPGIRVRAPLAAVRVGSQWSDQMGLVGPVSVFDLMMMNIDEQRSELSKGPGGAPSMKPGLVLTTWDQPSTEVHYSVTWTSPKGKSWTETDTVPKLGLLRHVLPPKGMGKLMSGEWQVSIHFIPAPKKSSNSSSSSSSSSSSRKGKGAIDVPAGSVLLLQRSFEVVDVRKDDPEDIHRVFQKYFEIAVELDKSEDLLLSGIDIVQM
eukprot:TRINITY_DN28401_c1_g1_i3.p1 TRINITY_DN28401_c1_g1~~TRINITY_DN28401_c1_g1_i3.p1  ORF type:complete len:636 (-),score=118.46 TRINITY_DN28401_c1_g1_i3:277-2049(-)